MCPAIFKPMGGLSFSEELVDGEGGRWELGEGMGERKEVKLWSVCENKGKVLIKKEK